MASRDIKVGLFVTFSLMVLGVVVFMIGEERKLFEKQLTMQAAFKDVKGLSRGSPVRMGGVDIGSVSDVGYTKNPKDDTIFVEMSIVSGEATRIRQDSYAEVKDKGLLGDKMIVITVGNPASPAIPPKGRINTQETRDLEQIIGDLKGTISGAERVVNNLEKTTDALADGHLHDDIKRTVAHLANVMQSIDSGEGYVPMLLKDKGEAARLSATVAEIRGAATELNQLLGSTRQVVDRVRSGPGFAHEVFYEQSGSQAISQLGGAAEELRLTLQGVREGRSLVHDLLYEEKSAEMVDSLNRTTADLSAIMADVRAGKGTLGSLLTDPSVYDDIKVLLGNVSRNRSLKALVRYSIKQDEQQHRVIDTQAQPAADTPPLPAKPVDERADARLE